MITIVDGIGVGAGKSYYVASFLVGYLAHGGTVYTTDNFKLRWPEMKSLVAERYGVELEDDQYVQVSAEDSPRIHEITPPGTDDNPVLLVLDEAQDQLNTRDTRDEKKRSFFKFLCQSRHDNNDLLFVTQDRNNIDCQIRRLATYVIRVRNMANFIVAGVRWPFKQFLWHVCDQDGKNVLRRQWCGHDKGIFGVYVSKAMQGAHKRVGAPVPKKQLKRVQKKRMKFMMVLVVLGMIFAAFVAVPRVAASWGGGAKQEAAKVVKPASTPPPAVPPGPVASYEIHTELFRGMSEGVYLRTDRATYEVGRMSSRGMVEMVRGPVARLRTPTGALMYVVGDESPTVRAASPVAPVPVPTPVPVADNKGSTGMDRVRAGLPPENDDKMERVRAGLPAKTK